MQGQAPSASDQHQHTLLLFLRSSSSTAHLFEAVSERLPRRLREQQPVECGRVVWGIINLIQYLSSGKAAVTQQRLRRSVCRGSFVDVCQAVWGLRSPALAGGPMRCMQACQGVM